MQGAIIVGSISGSVIINNVAPCHFISEIRKMQGAIIGGSIGGVSFLGILVGIIALVRWKRYIVCV